MPVNYISQLRQILVDGGLSQAQLATRLRVSFAALSRWLHGHATPQPRRLAAIQQLYQELVSLPAITERDIARAVREAHELTRRGLWAQIADHQALQDDLLLEHTYNSTSIEGTTFSKRETEAVIFHHRLMADKTLVEHLEVTNHATVLRGMLQRQYHGRLTEAAIKALHHGLLQGIRADAGSYSKHHRAIRGADIALTHSTDIPEEMRRILRAWRGRPARKTIREIAQFHADLELVHPFGDGNGRVGRLLMAWQCLQADYPPMIVENARKAEYYEVLAYAQRKAIGPLVCFLVGELRRTHEIIHKHLD